MVMGNLSEEAIGHIADRFKLLGNPARLRILQHLCEGESTVGDLGQATGFKQSHVSKHIGLLSRGGLVRRRTDGNRVLYSVADHALPRLCTLMKESILEHQAELLASLAKA
ncbi:MAG: metalloregulator ArsR/SmtB family transcription factor [Planctomycetes bacterium]|nr:metalloregulator ArsR/SmtB family transcription factor [Planctomycetota bacterium]